MENMIGVINENLRSVLSGIKEHREKVEKDLDLVNTNIEEKISIAKKYKDEVMVCRDKIKELEDGISSLENDLDELNSKFSSKNLEEILSVGNKEINTKIMEKRGLIDKERASITSITDKITTIKEELVELKNKKSACTEEYDKSVLVENFFDNKIGEILNISENHIEELYLFGDDTPKDEDLENANIEDNIDGSIFEEIDNFDIDSLNEDEIKSVIREDIEELKIDGTSDLTEDIVAEELDRLLDETSSLIIRTDELKAKTDAYADGADEPSFIDESGLDNMIKDEFTIEPDDENAEIDVEKEEVETDEFDNLDDILNKEADDLDIKPYNEKDDVIPYTGETDLEMLYNEMSDKEEDAEEAEDTSETITPEIKDDTMDIGLNILDELQKELDEGTALEDSSEETAPIDEFKNILNKHNMDPSLVDENADIVDKMDANKLDQIISLLKRNGISSENLKNVFGLVDKINVSKLEKQIAKKRDNRLTDLLYHSIDEEIEDTLGTVLDLDDSELAKLRKNVGDDTYEELNMFSSIVKTNIDNLSKYNVDNLKDCILTHPSRFLDNPDQFNEMLDKYDADDLVRCINKNPAVLDKL